MTTILLNNDTKLLFLGTNLQSLVFSAGHSLLFLFLPHILNAYKFANYIYTTLLNIEPTEPKEQQYKHDTLNIHNT